MVRISKKMSVFRFSFRDFSFTIPLIAGNLAFVTDSYKGAYYKLKADETDSH